MLNALRNLFANGESSTEELPEVHSLARFRRILQRERALADRNNDGFSLVVFSVEELDRRQIKRLSRELVRQVRVTDEVGWFEENALGAVLSFTPPTGAAVFGERVRRDLSDVADLEYVVYAYPSVDRGRRWDQSRGPRRAAPHTAASVITEPPTEALSPHLAPAPPRWKRILDVLGASVGMMAASPIFLGTAAILKVVSPGPVFFRQQRVGFRGQLFSIWKFRSMHVDVSAQIHESHLKELMEKDGRLRKLDGVDSRVIPVVGTFLRRSGLDELPQLLNVLKGEMSLVGPRPCMPYEAKEYALWQTRRFDAMPGLTGMWQVNGKNRTTFNQMIRLDLRYLRRRSLATDLGIALKTVPAIIGQQFDGEGEEGAEGKLESNPVKGWTS